MNSHRHSHHHPLRPGLPASSIQAPRTARRWPGRLAIAGLALLGLALVLGLLWWRLFALRPYQPSAEALAARYAHASAAPIAPQLRALGPREQEIRFISFDGAAVNGRIRYPSDPAQAKTPYPLLIALHGMGRSQMRWWAASHKGSETLEHTHRLTEQALQQGYAVLALDARRHGERKNPDYGLRQLMRDMHLWGERERYEQMIIDSIKDYRLLLDWLLPQAQIDARRVQVIGYSMGGQMALILGSLEPRISAVAAIVPPFVDDKVAAVSPQRFLPGLAGKSKLWLLSAEDDEYASAAQNQALFEAMPGAAKQHLRFPGGHILPRDYPERLAPWF